MQLLLILSSFFFNLIPTQESQLSTNISDVEIRVTKCVGIKSTNKVTIEFLVTSEKEFTCQIRTAGVPKAYDDSGQELMIKNKTGGWLNLFGDGTTRMATLSNGIPVNGKVFIINVSKSSRYINLLHFESRVTTESQKRIPPWEECVFKMIPIEWR